MTVLMLDELSGDALFEAQESMRAGIHGGVFSLAQDLESDNLFEAQQGMQAGIYGGPV